MQAFRTRPLCFCIIGALACLLSAYHMTAAVKIAAFAVFCLLIIPAVLVFRGKDSGPFGELTASVFVTALLLCALAFASSFLYYNVYVRGAAAHEARDAHIVAHFTAYDGTGRSREGVVTRINGREVNYRCLLAIDSELEVAPYQVFYAQADVSVLRAVDAENRQYYGKNIVLYASGEMTENTGVRARGLRSFFFRINTFARQCIFELCGDGAGFISCVILGNRQDISDIDRGAFLSLGISHLYALSGMHIIAVLAGFDLLLRRAVPVHRLRIVLLLLFAVMYVLICGCTLSVTRAAIMYILGRGAFFFGETSDPATSLFSAAGCICLSMPYSFFDAGLQLSVVSTFGIIAFGVPFCKTVSAFLRNKLGDSRLARTAVYVSSAYIISACAAAVVLPFLILYFDSFSPMSAVATLLASPFVTLLLYCAVYVVLLYPLRFAAGLFGFVCDGLAQCTLGLVRFLSSLGDFRVSASYSFIPFILIGALAVAAFLFFSGRGRAVSYMCVFVSFSLVFTLCLSVYSALHRSDSVVMLASADRSDILCVVHNNEAVLIDIGYGSDGAARRTAELLRERNIVTAEALVITHCHNSHPELITLLFSEYGTRRVYLPDCDTDEADAAVRTADELGCAVIFFDPERLFTVNENNIDIQLTVSSADCGDSFGCVVRAADVCYISAPDRRLYTDGVIPSDTPTVIYGGHTVLGEHRRFYLTETAVNVIIPEFIRRDYMTGDYFNEICEKQNVTVYSDTVSVIDGGVAAPAT